jgi:hypothetical protein
MTFGGKANPSEFSTISESMADLANTLLQCTEWRPSELKSPHAGLLGTDEILPADVPFTPAQTLLVDPDLSEGSLR